MTVRPLIEAARAYPAMERLVLGAKECVWLAFRIFDPQTRLHSEEARSLGLKCWADIARWSCAQGVEWRIRITDFDAIGATDLHGLSHRSVQEFRQAAPKNLQAVAALHPHELGTLPRLGFWWPARHRVSSKIHAMKADGMSREAIAERFPGLTERLVDEGSGDPDIRCWPPFSLHPIVHHEKLMIIDRDRMILGGLDVNERRFDDLDHDQPADQTWHDVSVLVEDEPATVREASRHFANLWNDVIGTQDHDQDLTPIAQPVDSEARSDTDEGKVTFVRTLSTRRTGPIAISPFEKIKEIEDAHLDFIANAQNLIYLETQYLRSHSIAEALFARARENPDLRLIALLPAAPDDVAFENNTGPDAKHGTWLQARAVDRILEGFGDRALFLSLVGAKAPADPPDRPEEDEPDFARVARQPIIYVHAKVMIVDGHSAIISSANLNGRSMRWDTESGVVWRDAEPVQTFQHALWKDHFKALDPPCFQANHVADEVFRSFQAAAAPDADTFVIAYPHHRAKRFAASKFYVPDNMV
jgi:phosphatidylserine/phosphatidylglycerophosphate/cardiolipin synthase-like enzyme